MHTMDFENSDRHTFNVVLLEPGEKGPAGPVADAQTVQFYDARYSTQKPDGARFTALGQLVVYYHADAIMPGYEGLILHGGVADWRIDADTMNLIRAWLREWWTQP